MEPIPATEHDRGGDTRDTGATLLFDPQQQQAALLLKQAHAGDEARSFIANEKTTVQLLPMVQRASSPEHGDATNTTPAGPALPNPAKLSPIRYAPYVSPMVETISQPRHR
jgi:hypothetical protein